MHRSATYIKRMTCLLAAGLLAAVNTASAQDDGTFFVSARIVDVKSNAQAGWEAAIADISAALGEGGREFNEVYQRIRGDLPTYTIFSPDADYNDLPPVNLDAGMVSRATGNINGNTLVTLAIDTDQVTNIEPGTPTPEYLVVRVFTVPLANASAFEEFMSDTVVPAIDDAGLMTRSGQVVMGGSLSTYALFVYSDQFPSGAGQALMRSMGERNYERMLEQGTSLISGIEDIAYRYRPDLSIPAD